MARPKIPITKPYIYKKSKLPVSLRTHKDEAKYIYEKKKGNSHKPFSEEEPIKEWPNWMLIHNKFPYSAAFKVHHLLVPKRQVKKSELNTIEKKELDYILDELNDIYDCYLVNFESKMSIKHHYHIHLLSYHDSRKKLKV